MDWLITGPLVFSERLRQPADQAVYCAGDSLGFIDPFTGSGILNAMLTGERAGIAAARGAPAASYLRDCRRLLRRPFLVSSVFRTIIASGHAGVLASLVPGRFLFHATRPSGLKLGA
jgi:flavin-dependent dehydrogenase